MKSWSCFAANGFVNVYADIHSRSGLATAPLQGDESKPSHDHLALPLSEYKVFHTVPESMFFGALQNFHTICEIKLADFKPFCICPTFLRAAAPAVGAACTALKCQENKKQPSLKCCNTLLQRL